MTSSELLADAFGRIRATVHEALRGLTPEQLAVRLDADANSIAWLVWHLTRIQDDHIAAVADVASVTVASGDLLVGYYDAVHEQTIRFVERLTDPDLDRIVDEAWDPPVTLGVRLVSVINDNDQHAGQAAFVHGIVLRR